LGINTTFYAHTPGKNTPWHHLVSHLQQTAANARENAAKFGAGELAYLAGLWHDLGKFNPEFQEYLICCERADRTGDEPPARSVPHAIYGAMFAGERRLAMIAPIIYGHHAGLQEPAAVKSRLADNDSQEAWRRIEPIVHENLEDMRPDGDPMARISDPPQDRLQLEFFLRMVFSALVDADFLDTEAHFDPENASLRSNELAPADLWKPFEADQRALLESAPDTLVNRVRAEVYKDCLDAAGQPQGIFRLSVPTGGGKTRSGLAFALRHAMKHDLDRVIFAVPYTSIIEQTAAEYRKIVGDEAVLEHHSAVQSDVDSGTEKDEREAEKLHEARVRSRLATQNWDAPLVVTTTVQLFESLFANRTSRCRKLHDVARSVIVLDEVQTLPLRLLTPILSALRELMRRYGVTVVLCTATQPALDSQSHYLEGFDPAGVRDIVPAERAIEHFHELRRVRYEVRREPWTWEEVAERLRESTPGKQAMAVLNTRKDALAMLDALDDNSSLHLSTLLCGAHRRRVLEEVRRRLAEGEPCLLVSTQVVEAGVDLDFPAVFRAIGPLDRIVQAAGRCNREGALPGGGLVVIFEPEGGRLPRGEYASAVAEARMILSREELDLHDPGVFRNYFSRMYQNVSTDALGIQDLRKRFDYPETAARFRLISEETTPVIVQYEEEDPRKEARRRRLIGGIQSEGALRPGDHRRLQPYVVGLFAHDLRGKEWLIEEIAEGVKLWTGEYDDVRGLSLIQGDPTDLVW
jgi:CRISPR-associated endonuclease/helicase Cas3